MEGWARADPPVPITTVSLFCRSEYNAFWKCVQAGVTYLFVQLCKVRAARTPCDWQAPTLTRSRAGSDPARPEPSPPGPPLLPAGLDVGTLPNAPRRRLWKECNLRKRGLEATFA